MPASLSKRLLLALFAGAAVGLLWWGLYVPPAHPLALLVGAHALGAVGIALALHPLGPRWRGPAPLLLALLLGLVAAPGWMGAWHARGALGGLFGALADVGAMGLGVGLGAGLGVLGRGGAVAAGLVFFGILASAGPIAGQGAETPQPVAAHVDLPFPSQPVVVLGLDGGDWSVMDPMIAAGELPNLADLVARGRHGVLRSMEPTYSPVVWTTIFTGQPPEVHGLEDWYSADARNRRVPTLWDIYGAQGLASLVVNVPGSWPAATVPGGIVLAGFPIPGLTTGARGQLVGQIVSSAPRAGELENQVAASLGEGRFQIDMPLAAPDQRPRLPGFSHTLLDTAVRKEKLRLVGHRLRLTATLQPEGVLLEGPDLAKPVLAGPGRWSDWLRIHEGDLEAIVQVWPLEAPAGELRLYLTPPFQAPWAPRFPFATGELPAGFFEQGEPFVVEGTGWRAHRDEEVSRALLASLVTTERAHASALLRLMEGGVPPLVVYPITVTDRVEHPFWRDHEPEAFDGARFPPHAGLEAEDPVELAYRFADLLVGEVLARTSPDSLVMVVSDHGFTHGDAGEGGHRTDGIWIAAGPMVPTDPEPLEISILDVTPTLLRCVGAPLAQDLAGKAQSALCPEQLAGPEIPTWGTGGPSAAAHGERIDASREEQLRALGYIED